MTEGRKAAATFFRRASSIAGAVFFFGFALCAIAQPSAATTKKPAASPQIRAESVLHTTRHKAGRPGHPISQKEAPKTPSDVAAQSPRITLRDGRLTVDAKNADLSTILNGVAQASGMKLDGDAGNARIFGVYGPGDPRQVLTELLDGVGYNFMMIGGTADGTPSELLLTARSGIPPARTAVTQKAASEDDDAAENGDDQEPPGPGAVMHVPPSVAQQADDSQIQQRVQQNMQRLQQMHNAIEQQQQQNQPQ